MKKTLLIFLLLGQALQSKSQATITNSSNTGDKFNTARDPSSIFNPSLYTGTASVAIPLYSYGIDGLDLGVSLNYDTRGIKVDQTAENTGLGWSLYAGGYISRDLNGMEDEGYLPRIDTIDGQYSFPKIIERRGNLVSSVADNINGHPTIHDKEYDVFEAHFAGRTLKFLIGTCYTDNTAATSCNCNQGPRLIVTYPKSEVNIEIGGLVTRSIGDIDYTNVPYPENAALSFTITDEKGNKFYFTRGDYEKRFNSVPYGTISYYYYATQKWNLTKIVTYNGHTILYKYDSFNDVTYNSYRDQQVFESVAHNEGYGINITPVANNISIKADSTVLWKGNLSHLTSISYPNGTTLQFNYDGVERCDIPGTIPLTSMSIIGAYKKNVSNTLTYRFNYAYFHSPVPPVGLLPGNSSVELPYGGTCESLRQSFNMGNYANSYVHLQNGLRLKLKSIDKIGIDNVTAEKYYTFDYNSTPLPDRLSPNKDFYGYYNGKNPVYNYSPSNFSNPPYLYHFSTPLHTFSYSTGETFTYGIDKTPDINYMQAFNLTKVTNELGGIIELYYKDHSLYNPQNAYGNGPAFPIPTNYDGPNANDGLCIDKVVKKDGYNIDNTTTTEYTFSNGQRFYRGGYFWEPVYYDYDVNGNSNDISRLLVRSRTYYSSMVSPRIYFNGSNHGYSYATVTVKGYNGEVINSQKYHFTNLIDEGDTTKSNLKLRIFGCQNCGYGPDMLGNTFHPNYLNEYKMGLVMDVSTYDLNGTLISQTVNSYADNPSIPFSYASTRIIGQNSPSATQPYNNDTYTPLVSKKSLLQSTVTTSYVNGAAMPTRMDYTYDSNDNITDVTWTDSKGMPCEKKFFYSGQFTNGFEIWKNDFLISKISMAAFSRIFDEIYSLKASAPVSHSDYDGANYTLSNDRSYSYDNVGNVIQTSFEDGKTFSASIWNTFTGDKIADVKNAQYSEIAFTSFEGDFQPRGVFDFNKGNFDFEPNNVVLDQSKAMTGHYYYAIDQTKNNPIVSVNAPTNKQYCLSFWCSSIPKVTLGNQPLTVSYVTGFLNGNWRLVNVFFNGNGSDKLSITTNGTCFFDEIRLHPVGAKMQSMTYEPLFGASSVENETGDITFIEYDVMGRKTTTRDNEKNIIIYQQQTNQGADN